jgi:hypothetical protein
MFYFTQMLKSTRMLFVCCITRFLTVRWSRSAGAALTFPDFFRLDPTWLFVARQSPPPLSPFSFLNSFLESC